MSEKLLSIGRVVGVHGIRGEIKIEPQVDDFEFLLELERLYFRVDETQEPRLQTVEASRPHKLAVLAKLDGISTRNDAELLIGSEVLIPESDRPKLPPGSFTLKTLLGLTVRDAAGQVRGTIADVDIASGRPILVMAMAEGGQLMVPFVREYVCSVSLPDSLLTVTEAFERLLAPEEVGP